MLGREYNGDEDGFTTEELSRLSIEKDCMYLHKVVRLNYTTYDMRRGQDTINLRTHPNVMLLAHEDDEEAGEHPYWYARVLSVFHVHARLHLVGIVPWCPGASPGKYRMTISRSTNLWQQSYEQVLICESE